MKTTVAGGLLATCVFAACGGDGGGGDVPIDAMVPTGPTYPAGPYGTLPQDTIVNLQWMGYFDTDADTDADPFNEEPRLFDLGRYFAENDPDAKVIWINSSAGWCQPCQVEAREFPGIAARYQPQGARFVTAIYENAQGNPADLTFARTWGSTYRLPFATVADTAFALEPYYGVDAVPMNMFVRTRDMKILNVSVGSDLPGLQRLVEYYIANP